MEGKRLQREVRRFPVRVEIHLQREEAAAARHRGRRRGVGGTLNPAARLGRPGAATPPSRRLVGVNQTRQLVKSAAGREEEERQCCRDTRPSSVAETQEQRAAPVRPEPARPAAVEKEGQPRCASVLLSPAGTREDVDWVDMSEPYLRCWIFFWKNVWVRPW